MNDMDYNNTRKQDKASMDFIHDSDSFFIVPNRLDLQPNNQT